MNCRYGKQKRETKQLWKQMEQNCDDADGREPKRRWKDDSPCGFQKLGGKKNGF